MHLQNLSTTILISKYSFSRKYHKDVDPIDMLFQLMSLVKQSMKKLMYCSKLIQTLVVFMREKQVLIIIFIFCILYRQLRNTRTRLHRHLFIAMAIQLAIRLTLYIDQAITRPNSSTSLNNHENQTIRGIDNTVKK
jgi:hypothetical protein